MRCLSVLVVLWLGRHVVSGGLHLGQRRRDGLAALRDVAPGLAERRFALLGRRRGGLVVAPAGLAQGRDQLGVGGAVGGAHVLARERPAGPVERLGQRLRRRRLLLRRLRRLELRLARLIGLVERAERLVQGSGVLLAGADWERLAGAERE